MELLSTPLASAFAWLGVCRYRNLLRGDLACRSASPVIQGHRVPVGPWVADVRARFMLLAVGAEVGC